MTQGVFVLDDDPDVREGLSELISAVTGRPCLPLASLSELSSAKEVALGCALAIVDVNLGVEQPSGLDAYGWLLAEQFQGRVVFLTGHGLHHPMVQRARTFHDVAVLQKPIDVDTLRGLLPENAPA
jgi:FixJ family two-component response regulator